MKIIATISDESFMVTVSKKEISAILGFDSVYNEEFRKIKLGVDSELDVIKIATTASYVRNLDKDRIQKAKESLVDAIKTLDNATENMQALYIFELLKEA
jgi:hypothetical protein